MITYGNLIYDVFIFSKHFFNIAGTQINVVKKWSHVPNYLYMVWGGVGHMAVVLFFPAIGLRLRIFQDYDVLGNTKPITVKRSFAKII